MGKANRVTSRNADRITAALGVFTPQALAGITITAAARARAVEYNPELEAALRPDIVPVEDAPGTGWQTWVYGGAAKD